MRGSKALIYFTAQQFSVPVQGKTQVQTVCVILGKKQEACALAPGGSSKLFSNSERPLAFPGHILGICLQKIKKKKKNGPDRLSYFIRQVMDETVLPLAAAHRETRRMYGHKVPATDGTVPRTRNRVLFIVPKTQ